MYPYYSLYCTSTCTLIWKKTSRRPTISKMSEDDTTKRGREDEVPEDSSVKRTKGEAGVTAGNEAVAKLLSFYFRFCILLLASLDRGKCVTFLVVSQ